jgi:hypothetical protein
MLCYLYGLDYAGDDADCHDGLYMLLCVHVYVMAEKYSKRPAQTSTTSQTRWSHPTISRAHLHDSFCMVFTQMPATGHYHASLPCALLFPAREFYCARSRFERTRSLSSANLGAALFLHTLKADSYRSVNMRTCSACDKPRTIDTLDRVPGASKLRCYCTTLGVASPIETCKTCCGDALCDKKTQNRCLSEHYRPGLNKKL